MIQRAYINNFTQTDIHSDNNSSDESDDEVKVPMETNSLREETKHETPADMKRSKQSAVKIAKNREAINRREKRSLIKRINSLSDQVLNLKEVKNSLTKLAEDMQEQNEHLKNELVATLQKVHSTRLSLQVWHIRMNQFIIITSFFYIQNLI